MRRVLFALLIAGGACSSAESAEYPMGPGSAEGSGDRSAHGGHPNDEREAELALRMDVGDLVLCEAERSAGIFTDKVFSRRTLPAPPHGYLISCGES